MDAARKLQEAVRETVELAVNHLFPQVKNLVAQEIIRQFEPPLKGLRPGPKARSTPSKKIGKKTAKKVAKKSKARKLSTKQMQCRHPGCTKRSMGPRYSFMCKRHEGEKPVSGRPNLTVLKGGANGNGKSSKVASKKAA